MAGHRAPFTGKAVCLPGIAHTPCSRPSGKRNLTQRPAPPKPTATGGDTVSKRPPPRRRAPLTATDQLMTSSVMSQPSAADRAARSRLGILSPTGWRRFQIVHVEIGGISISRRKAGARSLVTCHVLYGAGSRAEEHRSRSGSALYLPGRVAPAAV